MKIIRLKQVDSTNEYLKRNYKSLSNLTLVTSEYQSKGKGRLNHSWQSENNKNLLCSILILDKKLLTKASIMSVFSGYIILRLLKKLKLKHVLVKWPNDIYVNSKKISGVLVESLITDNKIDAIILGIGINLNQRKFSNKINATSYINETNKSIEIEVVLHELIKLLKFELFKLKHNINNYIHILNKNNYLLDKNIIYLQNGVKMLAKAYSINKNGTLNVKSKDQIKSLSISEVSIIDK